MEKKLKPGSYTRRCMNKFWYAVEVLPSYHPQGLFSTTVPRFLPGKLEPLGLSLSGQLRVAS